MEYGRYIFFREEMLKWMKENLYADLYDYVLENTEMEKFVYKLNLSAMTL